MFVINPNIFVGDTRRRTRITYVTIIASMCARVECLPPKKENDYIQRLIKPTETGRLNNVNKRKQNCRSTADETLSIVDGVEKRREFRLFTSYRGNDTANKISTLRTAAYNTQLKYWVAWGKLKKTYDGFKIIRLILGECRQKSDVNVRWTCIT